MLVFVVYKWTVNESASDHREREKIFEKPEEALEYAESLEEGTNEYITVEVERSEYRD